MASILSLFIYTRAIDRVDLFSSSLDAKSALIAWGLTLTLTTTSLIALLSINAAFYTQILVVFSSKSANRKKMAIWLLAPYVLSEIAFILALFEVFLPSSRFTLFGIPIITAVATFCALLLIPSFRKIIMANAGGIRWRASLYGIGLSGLISATTLITNLIPAMVVSRIYSGEDTLENRFLASCSILITMLGSLTPTLAFHLTKGPKIRKFYASAFSVLLSIPVLLLITPGGLNGVIYIAAKNLGIRQSTLNQFILSKDIQLNDLDNRQWRTKLRSTNRVEVTGFQLFSFGDTLLICPADILYLERYQLSEFTKFCISARSDEIFRKPKIPSIEWHWRQFAERYVNRSRVRLWSGQPLSPKSEDLKELELILYKISR